MKRFLEYTYHVVQKSLERYLFQVQKMENIKQEEEIKKKQHQEELSGGLKLRSILRDYRKNSKRLKAIDGKNKKRKS